MEVWSASRPELCEAISSPLAFPPVPRRPPEELRTALDCFRRIRGRSYCVGVACEDCGDPDTNVHLGGVEACDRCFDRRISAHTGLPRLPDAPPPIVLAGPDGRQHHLRYRVWRAGVGIEVQLDETGVAVGEGYRFAVLGDNDADVDALVAQVRSTAEAEIGRQLPRASQRSPSVDGR